jgi:hypothetical protein
MRYQRQTVLYRGEWHLCQLDAFFSAGEEDVAQDALPASALCSGCIYRLAV